MLLGGVLIFAGVYINQSKWINNIFKYSLNCKYIFNDGAVAKCNSLFCSSSMFAEPTG